jgi:hypothetical protein
VRTDGGRTEDGASGDLVDGNVVWLPRDWLGPRSELIPFGSAADAADAANAAEVEEGANPPVPPTASDFWGESSASVQDVLRAPAGGTEAPAFPRPPAGGLRAPATTRLSRPFTRLSGPFGNARAGAREALGSRARAASMLAAGAATLVLILSLLGTTARKGDPPGRIGARVGQLAAGLSSAAVPGLPARALRALERSLLGHVPAVISAPSRRPHRVLSRRDANRPQQHPRHRPRTDHPSTGTVQHVRYTRPMPPSSQQASGSPSPPAEPSIAPTGTASGGTSVHRSPSNQQPALGASGALAPGSSPDG